MEPGDDNQGPTAGRFPPWLAGSVFKVGTALAASGALFIFLSRGARPAIGFMLGTAAASGVIAGLVFMAAEAVLLLFRAIRALFLIPAGLGQAFRARGPASATRQRPKNTLRPVKFHGKESHGAASGGAALAGFAARAVGTVDLLTRRVLRAGDLVSICLGPTENCGATIPRDIRDELRREHEDRCPSCHLAGRFVETILPGVPKKAEAASETWSPRTSPPIIPPNAWPAPAFSSPPPRVKDRIDDPSPLFDWAVRSMSAPQRERSP